MLKICPCCWKEFSTDMSRVKCCSIACSSKMRTKYKDKICPICNKTFHPLNWKQKFCSPQCRLKWTDYKCLCQCWKEFYSKVPYAKYCSIECKKKYKREKNLLSVCMTCWKEFHPWHKWGKYCCNECKRIARKTINERVCPMCKCKFTPIADSRIYCSKQCYDKAQSKAWLNLSEEKKREILSKMQKWGISNISKINKEYKKYLDRRWYNTELEFQLWWLYYDLKVWDILIEINPHPWHSASKHPYWNPRPEMYHYNKAKNAIDRWYKIIEVRDRMSKKEVINILQNLKETIIGAPILHWYNPKTKNHLIDNLYNEKEMLDKWYVKIYDAWEKYIFNSTTLN